MKATMAMMPGAVTSAGMARGNWARARVGGDCWLSAEGGGEGAEGGAMII